MPIKINGSTSGSVTLAAPATGSDVTLTLPGSTGTVAVLGGNTYTGTHNFSGATVVEPAGRVLQVVSFAYSAELATTSGSAVDTGSSGSITPTSSSSKILVISNLQFYGQNTDLIWGRALRGSTTIVGASRICNSLGISSWSFAYLDSPATTSSTTYKIQVYKDTAGGTSFVCQWNSQQTSTLTLVEIAA